MTPCRKLDLWLVLRQNWTAIWVYRWMPLIHPRHRFTICCFSARNASGRENGEHCQAVPHLRFYPLFFLFVSLSSRYSNNELNPSDQWTCSWLLSSSRFYIHFRNLSLATATCSYRRDQFFYEQRTASCNGNWEHENWNPHSRLLQNCIRFSMGIALRHINFCSLSSRKPLVPYPKWKVHSSRGKYTKTIRKTSGYDEGISGIPQGHN